MLSESLTKKKFKDPLILELLQNIRVHRSMLEDLKSIKIDPKLTNIISKEIGRELYIENEFHKAKGFRKLHICLLYTSPSPRDLDLSRMPSSA